MDDAALDDVSNWRLCFWPTEPGQWWGGRFGHVSALGFSARTETWMHVDMHRRGLSIRLAYARDDVLDLLSALSERTVIVAVPRGSSPRFVTRPFLCTSFVKHLTGVRSRALRPDGLFRHLVAQGCEVLNAKPEAPEGVCGAASGPSAG